MQKRLTKFGKKNPTPQTTQTTDCTVYNVPVICSSRQVYSTMVFHLAHYAHVQNSFSHTVFKICRKSFFAAIYGMVHNSMLNKELS